MTNHRPQRCLAATTTTTSFYMIFLALLSSSTFVWSINFGLISPIEVVEEWGCDKSEIRLTCSRLDSTIAILEATFTPNCSASSMSSPSSNSTGQNVTDDDCVHRDLRRLTRAYISPKINHRLSETEAGRKFLQALRERHDEDEEVAPQVQASSILGSVYHRDDLKQKRTKLRASLEELIVEYLRSLAPDGEDQHLDRRHKRDINGNPGDTLSDDAAKNVNENIDGSGKSAINAIVVKNESHISDDRNDGRVQIDNENATLPKYVCAERKQRVTQLDRIELEKALQNESDYEHNIRRLLNYRCSGKNHCSFIFSNDHPFSIIWSSGVVRIKYVCMESFRLNKYCGEHLIIANESPILDPTPPTHQHRSVHDKQKSLTSNTLELADDDVEVFDEPVAEALIQNEQSFHHLKILKSSPQDEAYERQLAAAAEAKLDRQNRRKKIYSQDFRVLKILPSNLDEFNDIEKIGNEIYFKKENEMKMTEIDRDDSREVVSEERATTTNHHKLNRFHSTAPSKFENGNTIDDIVNRIKLNEDIDRNSILREIRSTSGYDKLPPATNLFWNDRMHLSPTTSTSRKAPSTPTAYRADITNSDDYDDYASYEDYDIKVDGTTISRKNKMRVHTSYQKAAIRQPVLQQGFISSPGYPQYYIGDSNCSWRISVPKGERIRLTILDISLRYDTPCRDFLEIREKSSDQILLSTCTEQTKPLQLISESDELVVTFRTKSRVAYPKRGVLIHYAALGCIEPPEPRYGRLVFKTIDSVKFICDPSYVFPDTVNASRELICTSRNIWNRNLPDCVERSMLTNEDTPYVQSSWNQNRNSKNGKTMDNDTMNDIVIPSLVIIGLLVANVLILLAIMRCRNKSRKNRLDELAQL